MGNRRQKGLKQRAVAQRLHKPRFPGDSGPEKSWAAGKAEERRESSFPKGKHGRALIIPESFTAIKTRGSAEYQLKRLC